MVPTCVRPTICRELYCLRRCANKCVRVHLHVAERLQAPNEAYESVRFQVLPSRAGLVSQPCHSQWRVWLPRLERKLAAKIAAEVLSVHFESSSIGLVCSSCPGLSVLAAAVKLGGLRSPHILAVKLLRRHAFARCGAAVLACYETHVGRSRSPLRSRAYSGSNRSPSCTDLLHEGGARRVPVHHAPAQHDVPTQQRCSCCSFPYFPESAGGILRECQLCANTQVQHDGPRRRHHTRAGPGHTATSHRASLAGAG